MISKFLTRPSFTRCLPAAPRQCLYCHASPVKLNQRPLCEDEERLLTNAALHPASSPVCSRCGFFYYDRHPFILAVIGAPNAGKSTYFPRMIHQLHSVEFPGQFGLHALQTAKREMDGRFTPGFSAHELVKERYPDYGGEQSPGVRPTLPEKTASWDAESLNRAPFLYHNNLNNRGLSRLLSPSEVVLSIRDCAGEEFLDESQVRQLHKPYLEHASGIMLCIDPDDLACGMDADAIRVVENLLNVVSKQRRRVAPLSVMITKFDRFMDSEPVIAQYLMGSPLAPDVMDQWESVNRKLKRWTLDHNGKALLNLIGRGFGRVGWFPVSALGYQPREMVNGDGSGEEQVPDLASRRVLDPLLFIYKSVGAM